MADPIEGATGAVKKVPKWAWIAGAGITGGILFYRHKNSSSTPTTAPATDATAPADYGQTYSPFGTVTAPSSGAGTFADPGAVPAGGLALSDVTDLLSTIHQNDPAPPPPMSAVDLLDSVLPFIGGGAPQSSTTQAPPAPPYVAPTPPPPPAPPVAVKDLCTGAFPFDAGGGDCYRVECNPPGHAKGRWHFHKNGSAARVQPTC